MVLDATPMENSPREPSSTLNPKIIKGSVLGVFILSLPLTTLIMGLQNIQEPAQQIILHLQKEGEQSYQHLEVITPNGHSVERFDLFGKSSKWPRYLHSPPSDLGPTQPTSAVVNEEQGGLFLYDDWKGRLQLSSPAMDAPDVNRHFHLLLDRSGTMKREGGDQELNALARVYAQLNTKRKQDPRPWKCFSFASSLETHGVWPTNGAPPPGLFAESRGTTALIQALEQLKPQLKESSDIVIISDGETDTRDLDSLERSLESLSRKGHRLALLSPDFKPVDLWQKAYDAGSLSNSWPTEAPSKIETLPYQHSMSGSRWGKRRRVRLDDQHVVLLRDQEGRALLSLEAGTSPMRFHVIGELLSPSPLLKDWLLERFGNRPSLLLNGNTIQVNLGIKSHHSLSIWGETKQKAFPSQPGHYEIPQPSSGDLDFFHPETGPFRLEGLEQWPQKEQHVITRWSWNLSNLSSPRPPSLEPWFKTIILSQFLLLLSLWHLNRPNQKK